MIRGCLGFCLGGPPPFRSRQGMKQGCTNKLKNHEPPHNQPRNQQPLASP
ncbi:hypothetical protein DP23_4293 [Ralstonia pickettii]|nr:hypothetical protein DP23_4293 [Ralstonia pickettii]